MTFPSVLSEHLPIYKLLDAKCLTTKIGVDQSRCNRNNTETTFLFRNTEEETSFRRSSSVDGLSMCTLAVAEEKDGRRVIGRKARRSIRTSLSKKDTAELFPKGWVSKSEFFFVPRCENILPPLIGSVVRLRTCTPSEVMNINICVGGVSQAPRDRLPFFTATPLSRSSFSGYSLDVGVSQPASRPQPQDFFDRCSARV